MNKRLLDIIKYVFWLFIGCVLLFLTYRKIAIEELIQAIETININWIIAAQAANLSSHWLRGYRWKMLLKTNNQELSSTNAFAAVMFGYMVNNALPRMGEISRCSILVKSDNIPFTTNIGTVVIERIIDVISLLILVGLVVLLELPRVLTLLPNEASHSSNNYYLLIMMGGAALLALGIAWVLRAQLMKITLFRKALSIAIELIKVMANVRKVSNPALFIILSIAIWVGYIIATWCVIKAFPALESLSIGFYFAFVITAMGGIGMALPIPSGAGSYHVAVQLTFKMFQYSASLGSTLALLIHTPQLILNSIVGAICYFYLILQPSAQKLRV